MQLSWLKPGRSLSGRIVMTVTGAVSAALVLSAVLSVWREVDRYAAAKQQALTTVAQVFAYGGAKATAANDSDGAALSLRAIGRVPSIVYAAIERSDGSILAEQGLGLRLSRDAMLDGEMISVLELLTTRTVQAVAPIVENGVRVGRVVLIGETDDLLDNVLFAGRNAALAALLALVIGVAVSLNLQRSLTRPLASLARTMDVVRLQQDYGQRAAVMSHDEVGVLAGTFNDLLTALNERDRRLAAHSAHLEEEVRARTLDLSEATQAAERANEAKSTFLATMSHEIRTPMNGVLVMAELLAGSDLPPRQRRYADVIARSGKSLLAIIDDILDFAKVEAGKLDLERVPLRPAEVADTVVTLFAERARSAGIGLTGQIAPEVPPAILGDPVRLGQVASNFVSNALKFTAEGQVSLHLHIDPADGFLVLSVTDTGIGIPEDKLGTIFSAFSQADQSTTRRFGGTGLGLSIAQRIVEAMGGSVGVESQVGKGSTFFARWPIEAVDPASVVESQPVAALPRFPGLRVLVADDSAVNREVALEALSRCGVTDVVAVENGVLAVEATAAHRFDLILMDGNMPEMDGFSAAKAIRQRESESDTQRTAIVALTAHVLADAAEAAEEAGMDGVLAKPFTLRQLADVLARYASESPALDAADLPSEPHREAVSDMAEPDALLDPEVIEGLRALGDGAFLDRVVGLYQSQAPVALSALQSALDAADQPAIARAAHSLKSMSANVGALALVRRLTPIEAAARSAQCALATGEIEILSGLLDATTAALGATVLEAQAA